MPITYEINHDLERVHVVAIGDVRIEDLVALVSELASARVLAYAQLFDARAASVLLSADDTRRMVTLIGRLREEHGHARTALIAESDVSFGMARMYATLAAEVDHGFMVYRTIDEGTAWLGWQRAASGQWTH